MGEFGYGANRLYGLYGISNSSFDGSSWVYSIETKIGTCVIYELVMRGFEHGANRTYCPCATVTLFIFEVMYVGIVRRS